MKPALFEYSAPTTVREAVALLAADPGAMVLAGGQSLVPAMNLRLASRRPASSTSSTSPASPASRSRTAAIVVKAMTRHRELELSDVAFKANPVIREAMAHVAHIPIRNRGTVVGSLCHADAAAEMPMVLMLTGGSVVAEGPDGRRTIPAEDFFQFHMTTSRAAGRADRRGAFPGPAGGRRRGLRRVHPPPRRLCDRRRRRDRRLRSRRPGEGRAGRHLRHRLEADAAPRGRGAARRKRGHGAGPRRRRRGGEGRGHRAGRHACDDILSAAGGCDPRPPCGRDGGETRQTRTLKRMPRARQKLSVPSVSSDPKARVSITVNGEQVERDVSVRLLLSDFLRHELRLTGTHVGCEHGVCGACTVLIDGKAGRSCLTFAVQASGHEVRTIESLADEDGTLHPIQAGLPGLPCPAVRLLHAGHDHEHRRPVRVGRGARPHRRGHPRSRSPAISAAARATRTSSPRSARPRTRCRRDRGRDGDARLRIADQADHRPDAAARRGRLRRRHPARQSAPRRLRPQPLCAGEDHVDRRHRGARPSRRRRRLYRRGHRRPRPRDAAPHPASLDDRRAHPAAAWPRTTSTMSARPW